MGLIGREIVQTRAYQDPTAKPIELNYKFTFPITVFDAVRQSMEDDTSLTLQDALDQIWTELRNRQPIFPGRPANYLMTYAGTPGAVGAMQISTEIPMDITQQRQDRIPTEKAVGDLLSKLGLIDENGNVDPEAGMRIRWSEIIGRPNIYTATGNNEDGFMTQKAVSQYLKDLEIKINDLTDANGGQLHTFVNKLNAHIVDTNNPHGITADQIGAVSEEALRFHIEDAENPHHITAEMIGLCNVDNTSDEDKPLSAAARDAINKINESISAISGDITDLDFVVNAEYNQSSGQFTVTFRSGNIVSLHIPINGLIDEISYDPETKEIIFIEISGEQRRVDMSDLFIRYIGSEDPSITVTVEGNQTTGDQVIHAEINANGITADKLADGSITTRSIQDQAVTGSKIKDLTITTINLADNSVTTEKINPGAITNTRLADRAVDGRSLFSSPVANRILAVGDPNTDPIWSLIKSPMIDDDAITSQHILNGNITTEKLHDLAVTTSKIEDGAITSEKLASDAVNSSNIANFSIPGDKLAINITLQGHPMISMRPNDDADDNQIPDTRWVMDKIRNINISHANLDKRVVDGSNLFTSDTRNRVLVVGRANTDPVWGQINNEMMEENSIGLANIMDLSIDAAKIRDKSIETRHLSNGIIHNEHIVDSAVDSAKLFPANEPNMVLASIDEGGHPVYTKVNQEMIEPNAVGTMQIQDGSITPAKVETSDIGQVVLGVSLRNTTPLWMKVTNQMISDRAIDGRTLFSAPVDDMVLATHKPGTDPGWMKINGEMISERVIDRQHIMGGAIWREHLQEKIIEGRHIEDWTITSDNIAPGAITSDKLFTADRPNQVMAVTDQYTKPIWTQVHTDMIKDKAITKEKMMQSENPYRVLGATQAGVPPEYLMITHHFIVDGSIISSNLERNFVLQGTPELTNPPALDADNYQIPNTNWVRRTVAEMINNFNPEILFDKVTSDMIQDGSITGEKLWTHPYGPRVLGITAPNEQVEFILIEEDLIVDGAVTTNKLQRSIHLLGSPILEVRPQPNASDQEGGGDLIPDCQWVLDRIAEAIENGGIGDNAYKEIDPSRVALEWELDGLNTEEYDTSNALERIGFVEINATRTTNEWNNRGLNTDDPYADDPEPKGFRSISESTVKKEWDLKGLNTEEPEDDTSTGTGTGPGSGESFKPLPGSITTEMLMKRSITPDKLFSSITSHRLLGVKDANSDPQYLRAYNEMFEDRSVDARVLFSSDVGNRLLGVNEAGTDPTWMLVQPGMLEENTVGTAQILDEAITHDKIAQKAIDRENLVDKPLIDSTLLYNGSVDNSKITNGAIDKYKLADGAVNNNHLADDLVLPGHPTVAPDTEYETRSLRNIILSPDKPTSGNGNKYKNGDIWFQYI